MGLDRAQAVGLLSSLTSRLPGHDTLRHLLDSLAERRPPTRAGGPWQDTVNVVGTGGGPATFNVSTAAAFVAAAAGVKVVKTGSRAYTSALGSVDLLERLGVRLTSSYTQTEDVLAEYGIAFAGPFVYPAQLTRLARTVAPLAMKPFGRFLNALGPFLADLPVTAQVTGVSAAAPLDTLRELAATTTTRRIWLTANHTGADELLPFAVNTVYGDRSATRVIRPGELVPGEGSFEDLRPVSDPAGAVPHFLSVLAERRGPGGPAHGRPRRGRPDRRGGPRPQLALGGGPRRRGDRLRHGRRPRGAPRGRVPARGGGPCLAPRPPPRRPSSRPHGPPAAPRDSPCS